VWLHNEQQDIECDMLFSFATNYLTSPRESQEGPGVPALWGGWDVRRSVVAKGSVAVFKK